MILQEDLTSLGQQEADRQMKSNVANCHQTVSASQTNTF